jgi:DNA polymerase III epsilon subunit-like protein
MLSLIFDCETTGKINFDIPFSDETQPHLVELAFELFDQDDQRVVAQGDIIVAPLIRIPREAQKIHGITDERAKRYGVRPVVAAAIFSNFVTLADRLVCHNVQYDISMMAIEFTRLKRPTSPIMGKSSFCTMEASTDIIRIPFKNKKGFKWPSLDEAYRALVDKDGFSGAHQASNDVQATRKILLALEKKHDKLTS